MAIFRRRYRPDSEPDPGLEEARERLERAERDLAAARQDDGKVNDLTHRMHEIRRANRFATMMRQALRGGQ